MDVVFWIVGGAIAFFIAWWVIKIGMAIVVPPEVSGKAFLKRELKRQGVDVTRIPDGALDEIVQYCLSGARDMARASQLAPQGLAEYKNWRANLVGQIQVHVPVIQNIMAGGRPTPSDEKIREILVRNGVVHS